MSLLEIGTIVEEAFGHLGYCDFSYKMPNIDGLSSISKDNDVLEICKKNLIQLDWYMCML